MEATPPNNEVPLRAGPRRFAVASLAHQEASAGEAPRRPSDDESTPAFDFSNLLSSSPFVARMSTLPPNTTDVPEDPCAPESEGSYNQPLHIGAIFIILTASLLGTIFPILGKRFPKIMPSAFFYVCGKHLGTGVLLALGFIHLLTPAFDQLTNECLPDKILSYAYAPLFTLIAAIVMHFIDVLLTMLLAHSHEKDKEANNSSSTSDDDHGHEGHSHAGVLGRDAELSIAAYILEFGLTSHSIIIGLAVGVSPGKELRSLIPALSFHQFFEGFALGARLADVGFSGVIEGLLTFLYCVSAPLGISIGIGIHRTYNGNAAKANIIQGTFDAISAGIILYVAFVQLLAIDFVRDIRRAKGWLRKVLLFACLWVGAAVMAVIGKWL